MATNTAPSHHLAGSVRRWPTGGHPVGATVTASLHLLLGLPMALAVFVPSVTIGLLAVGFLPIYPIALLALVAWLAIVHASAAIERARLRAFLGVHLVEPPPLPSGTSWHARLWASVRHHTTWRAATYHVVRLPVTIVTFTLTVVALTLPLALVAAPLALIGTELGAVPLPMVLATAVAPLLGLLLVPLAVETVHALAMLEAAVAASLLGESVADRQDRRIERLSTTRSEMVDIAQQERRRIERDLHDGAGQQLVSLAMTLGMAREKLAADPERAQALIDEAHAEAKQALVDLRDIVRGISPAILNDRGLGPALSAVAAGSVVPVTLEVDVPERPDAVTEGIAYYLVCECISNAIRHADASRIRVRLTRRGQDLEVEVGDDGRGGADASRGTGLRGLAGRVAAVDGELELRSPEGGGTTLVATLPIRGEGTPASGEPSTSAER